MMEGERVRRLRVGFGLSQERFARLLGVSLQTVRRWEGGLSRPLPFISERLEELERELLRKGGEMAKRRREEDWFGLGGLFKSIGNIFDLVTKMVEEGKEEYTRRGEVKGLGEKMKGVYGFSIKIGLCGRPITIEHFGNIRQTEMGVEVAEVREPLVDVLDEGEEVVVIAEIPGVEEKDIKLEVKGDILELYAEGRDRKYSKEVLLPSPVDAKSIKCSYKNGILEVRLKKAR